MAEIEGAELLLYPNPADDVVHYLISFTGQTGQSCDIRLRDLTGRLLLERFELITGQQISGFIALDLPAGWYTISVQTENGYLLTNPLIIE
ncbi:MAG TPA: T9SS type A sorting domain-containing protein, partial [Chitinophagales bacterium]|nr:T9SS type A sorting domain-containing protein [Chitinophagales bacterium]